MDREVPLRAESSRTVAANDAEDDSCNLYVVAPEDAFQLKVKTTGTSDVPFDGDVSPGAEGGLGKDEVVVKLEIVQPLDPPEFVACTLQ